MIPQTPVIAVIGLGYVGLPLAVAYSRKYQTIGYDINPARVKALKEYSDNTRETTSEQLHEAIDQHHLLITSDETDLNKANTYIVTVPTPINEANQPDLEPLRSASALIGAHITKGDVVIYESTTFPTCTENYCAPIIEKVSGLKFNQDFTCGYSPERINPADKTNKLENITKITSGSTPQTADYVDKLYNTILLNGTHRAPNMATAEMAKAIENAQRDTNIAFVNEIAMLCSRIGIDTQAVLDAAGTKWNFIHMKPGLVGGHCISVDPYYLQYIGNKLGYTTDVINAARRTNEQVPHFIADRLILEMAKKGKLIKDSKILVLGCTFKENCPDTRNSKVFHIINDLVGYGAKITIFDPYALTATLPKNVQSLHCKELTTDMTDFDAVVVAVAHDEFKDIQIPDSVITFDIKHVLPYNEHTLYL